MANVLRILEKVYLTRIGTLYTVERHKDMVLSVGNLLYDLKGNAFQIKAIEKVHGPFLVNR